MTQPAEQVVESSEELTPTEQDQLTVCEAIVRDGLQTFKEVGTALAAICDGKLYRQTHTSFEAYLSDEFGISKSYGHRMISAAKVKLSPIGDSIHNEAQARELVPMLGDPDRTRAVVERAVTARGNLTASALRAAVEELDDEDRRTEIVQPERAESAGTVDIVVIDADPMADRRRRLDALYELAYKVRASEYRLQNGLSELEPLEPDERQRFLSPLRDCADQLRDIRAMVSPRASGSKATSS